MIKFKDKAFVKGQLFTYGMIAEFDAITEADLIADGDAEIYVAQISGTIDHASTADFATNAANAVNATNSQFATSAQSAVTANSANTATTANTANSASTATTALSATTALNADHASTADTASTADHATTATSATSADTATHAVTADSATAAATADFALSVDGTIQTYTWNTRPVYAATDVGTIINVSDVGGEGGSFWRATSFGWVPLNGTIKLASKWGTQTTPVATVTGTANGFFSITGGAGSLTIPATMLIPAHSVLRIRALVRRRGANGTAILKAYLGTVGDTTDAAALSVTYSQNDGRIIRGDIEVGVITSSSMSTTNWVPITYVDTSGSILGEMTANINTNSSMFIKFAIVAANSLDAFDLIGYSVVMESL